MTSNKTLLKKIDAELLFPDTHSLTYEIKLEVFMKSFLNTSTCLTLVNNIYFLCSLENTFTT